MGSKIQSFQTTFRKGVAKPNQFDVEFTLVPGGLGEFDNLVNNEMSLRVQSVTMPGKNITTTPNDNAYGPSYEMANGVSFAEDIEVTYILDIDHRVRTFFNAWQDTVVNPSTYDLNYYKDYIGTMVIYQCDQNEKAAVAVQLDEVYPKSVGPISYSMENGNSFQTVTVNMAFRRWQPLAFAFAPTTAAEAAAWINNPDYNVQGMLSRGALNELYKISQKFGIPLPAGVESAANRVQALVNFGTDPTTFLKRQVAQRVSGKIGGFRLPLGL